MPRFLLIVDDREDLRVGFHRYFIRFFDEVLVASDPASAEELLSRSVNAPTHVVCDYWFGEEHPVGASVLPAWRRRYPSIVKAALVSGSEVAELPATEGIDAVFEKPVDLKSLRAFLIGQ